MVALFNHSFMSVAFLIAVSRSLCVRSRERRCVTGAGFYSRQSHEKVDTACTHLTLNAITRNNIQESSAGLFLLYQTIPERISHFVVCTLECVDEKLRQFAIYNTVRAVKVYTMVAIREEVCIVISYAGLV